MAEQTAHPIKVLEGPGSRLELYPDRIIIRRTDQLSRLFPGIFGSAQVVPLEQIRDIRIYSSRVLTREWIQIAIIGAGATATFVCSGGHDRPAYDMKAAIEAQRARVTLAQANTAAAL